MNLQEFQGKLLGLIKSTYEPVETDPAYLRVVRNSHELNLVKEICIWWRCFQIENYCPLTSEWLKRLNTFEACVEQYYQDTNVPSYIELAGIAFLGYVQSHVTDRTTSSIAGFERAIIQVKSGDSREFIIAWNCDPYSLLNSLLCKIPYEETHVQEEYKVTVSHAFPDLFTVVKNEMTQADG